MPNDTTKNSRDNGAEELNHILQARRDKLTELREAGKDPFVITKYDQTHHSDEIKAHYDELEGKECRTRWTPKH